MASKTKATELKRLRKKKNGGRKRKNKAEILGTTRSQKELFGD